MEPIWKDYLVDLGAAPLSTGVAFSIVDDEDEVTIFTGRAYPRYNNAHVNIRINDICAEYLNNELFDSDGEWLVRPFSVYVGATKVAEVEFYNNWSYDLAFVPERDGFAFPIVRTFAKWQYIPITTLAPINAIVTDADGTAHSVPVKTYESADFNNDFNNDFLISVVAYGGARMLDMRAYPNAVKVEMGGKTWVASKACPRYVLYYKNAYGGWDSLPLDGRPTRADAVTRHTLDRSYNNGTPTSRGKANWLNEIHPTWELRTGWLNAEQSRMMHHPLNSTSAFLHDMETGQVDAVVLTNSTTEYKETPGMLYAYTLEVSLAQDRIRR